MMYFVFFFFFFFQAEDGIRDYKVTGVQTCALPISHRAHRLGWHVQLHLRGEQIVEMAGLIERLPGTVVIDHMARLPQPEGIRHQAFQVVRKLLDTGRVWVKLSAPYLDSKTGAPRYADIKPVARA